MVSFPTWQNRLIDFIKRSNKLNEHNNNNNNKKRCGKETIFSFFLLKNVSDSSGSAFNWHEMHTDFDWGERIQKRKKKMGRSLICDFNWYTCTSAHSHYAHSTLPPDRLNLIWFLLNFFFEWIKVLWFWCCGWLNYAWF